ncbi:MAG: hypothetical protein KDC04_03550 [Saprospiraceae bacterium]|nr:hypothetical protein [Saprospiraceae bacterium]MCB9309126.1 hypothetical protein [Lewinellaceae bacterium]
MTRSIIAIIVLAALTIVVPLGSWYYLKMGHDYRKEALKQLLPKDSIDYTFDSLGIFKGKVTVFTGADTDTSIQRKINDQFGNSPFFQMYSCNKLQSEFASDNVFRKKLDAYCLKDFVLVDTSLRIRNTYQSDLESLKTLVAHIAILLPQKKELDIKMK